MGKAGRRKKDRQKRNPIAVASTGNSNVNDATDAAVANPQSALHRLRHADPKIRCAALVALQASVLSQLQFSNKTVSMTVLQAVREQVTSPDLECSAVAADCLAQYLMAVSNSNSNSNSNKNKNVNNSEQQKQTTASWALVLLGRLDDCQKTLSAAQQQSDQSASSAKKQLSKNQQKKADKLQKQWYAVAAPCFIALCQLIEDNGHALDQINLQKNTFVRVVSGMLSLESKSKRSLPDTTGTGTSDDMDEEETETAPHDRIFAELRDTTALFAARCLHSALDDNQELAGALNIGNAETRSLWRELLGSTVSGSGSGSNDTNSNYSTMPSHALSPTTRLHLIGCLVNLYQLTFYEGDGNGGNGDQTWLEETILEQGIQSSSGAEGLLLEVLLSGKGTNTPSNQNQNSPQSSLLRSRLAANEANYRAAQGLLEKQQRDQLLEDEIDAAVKERNEPAKSIARRQKKVKEAKREAFREKQKAAMIADAETADDDMDMEDAANENEIETSTPNNNKPKDTMNREQDGEEAINEAFVAWTSTTGPIQLGLEIFTNLVSTLISGGGDGDGDDDPMGNVGGHPGSTSKLLHTIQSQGMASRLSETLLALSQFLRTACKSAATAAATADISDSGVDEDPIRNDGEETIGKVSACVVNCFLSGILDAPAQLLLWDATFRDLRTELNGSVPSTSTAVVDACSAILAVVVEMNPLVLRSSCNSGNSNSNININSNSADHISVFRSLLPNPDAVCLLSSVVLLEAEATASTEAASSTEGLVRSLTEEFLVLLRPPQFQQQAGSPNTRTQTLVLKTFMDWYGNDGFYPHLFDTLKVSDAIAAALALLATHQTDLDLDEEQLQILHNSQRFLEYKKQLQLQSRRR